MPRVEVYSFEILSKHPQDGDDLTAGSNCKLYESQETALKYARDYQKTNQYDTAVAIRIIAELATLSDDQVAELSTGLVWGSNLNTQTLQLVELSRVTLQLDGERSDTDDNHSEELINHFVPNIDYGKDFPTFEESSFFEFRGRVDNVYTWDVVESLAKAGFEAESGKTKAAYVIFTGGEEPHVRLVYLLDVTAYSWIVVDSVDKDFQAALSQPRQTIVPKYRFSW